MPITVSQLAIAPVKGLRLAPVDELELRATGAVGDRAYVLVDENGKLLLTARTPRLLQVSQRWDPLSGALTLGFPGGAQVTAAPAPGEAMSTALYHGRRIGGRLTEGPHSGALSEHLGRPVRLVALDPAEQGADDFPVSLMSAASVAAVGAALGAAAFDPRRFRMTITVDGAEPWEENGWAGREIGIGRARLRVIEPVPRCVVTTRDPDRGRRDLPILRTLAELHGKRNVVFGVWCEVGAPGRVRRGDQVAVGGTA